MQIFWNILYLNLNFNILPKLGLSITSLTPKNWPHNCVLQTQIEGEDKTKCIKTLMTLKKIFTNFLFMLVNFGFAMFW